MNRKSILMITLIYIAAWIATAVAVIFAIKLTGSAWCLWGFIFPGSIKIETNDEDEEL